MLAAQGQLDSTYYANLLGDYLQGQQSQSLSNTANLLTNQATQNYNLAQWLPQFKQSVAGSLGNLGQNKASLEQTNLMLPMNTYIPGLSNLYSMGQGTAQQQYQDALAQWQYNEEQAGKPTDWALGLSKMMSIADPGGSYMGFYQNPEQTSGASAQSMQGIGKAMELYSAYKGMGMGGQGGQASQQYQYTPNTNANLSYYTPQTQNYGLNSNPNYGFNYDNASASAGNQYGYNNPYSSWYNPNWR